MAIIEKYCLPGLTTGNNDGTTEEHAWQTFALAVSSLVAGERMNVSNKENGGARIIGESNQTFSTDATGTAPIHIRGYTDDEGDEGFFLWGHTLDITGHYVILEQFDIEIAQGFDIALIIKSGSTAYRCKLKNTGAGNCLAVNSDGGNLIQCSFMTTQATNACCDIRGRVIMYGCRIESNAIGMTLDPGFQASSAHRNLIIGSGSSTGIVIGSLRNTSILPITSNTIYNFVNGITIAEMIELADFAPGQIIGNLIYNCSNAIANDESGTVDTTMFLALNATGAISSTVYDFGDQPILDPVTLTGDPFTNSSSDDFTLNDISGAGASCRSSFGSPAYAWSL